MTLILEIAAGITLGVAIIALIVTFRESVAVAVMGLISLSAIGTGIAVLYFVVGSLENVALLVAALGAIGGAMYLIEFSNAHKRYGARFRAISDSISASTVLATFVSLIIWLPLSIFFESWLRVPYQYVLVFPVIGTFSLSVLFFYKRGVRKDSGIVHGNAG